MSSFVVLWYKVYIIHIKGIFYYNELFHFYFIHSPKIKYLYDVVNLSCNYALSLEHESLLYSLFISTKLSAKFTDRFLPYGSFLLAGFVAGTARHARTTGWTRETRRAGQARGLRTNRKGRVRGRELLSSMNVEVLYRDYNNMLNLPIRSKDDCVQRETWEEQIDVSLFTM